MILLLLGRTRTCSLGVKAGGFSWLLQQILKDIPPKNFLIDCCYWNVDSVISDKSHDEVFTEDESFEKCWKRHPVFPDTNNILDCSGIGYKSKKDE